MSWYSGQNEGFIDATQILQSGGGGASQTELNEINQDITEINEIIDELKEVFIPKQLNIENGSLDTVIVNNTANSRIFIKNQNSTPKIKIEGGKLYLYYDYDFTNAPTITTGWIDVDNYITAIKQSVLTLDANSVAIDILLLAPVTGLKPRFEIVEPLAISTATQVTQHEARITSLEDDYLNSFDEDEFFTYHRELASKLDQELKNFRDAVSQYSEKMSQLIQTSANYTNQSRVFEVARLLYNSKNALFTGYLQNILFGLGGVGVVIGVVAQIYDIITSRDKETQQLKLLTLYEKIKNEPLANELKFIHLNGLSIIESTNDNFSTSGFYTITLPNQGKLSIQVKVVDSALKAFILKVKEEGSYFYNVNDIINIPKSSLGGTTGNLEIQVTSLISEVQIISSLINELNQDLNLTQNRRRLRDGIINTNEIGDGLTTEYNSTITNAETGEVLQVPTIKLKINTDQLKLLNGTLNINKYVNQDNIDIINGNIATQDLEIADINDSLERVYKVILPDGETMTSGYKLNLGYKEIFTGYACDLMMLAVNKNTYVSFDADNYNNDYLGYFPNMARVAMTGDVKVISQNNLLVNTADQFTKGFIFLKNSSEFSTYNLNRKFEFLCFLKFVSFNNNSTDYHILQSAIDLITQVDIDTTRLGVWIRNRKLKVQHPALVEYMEYGINPTNVLTRYIVNNNYIVQPSSDDDIFIVAEEITDVYYNPPEYNYSFSMRSIPYYGMYNNSSTLIKVINDAYTAEQNESTNYLIFYLSHPNDPSRPIANCFYPSLKYNIGISGALVVNPPTYIKRVTIKFDILISTQTSVGDQYPLTTQQSYADTVAKCDFTFQFIYTFDGITQIQHNFTMADVNPTLTTTGTTYFNGWGGSIGGGQIYFPKRYWTYTFDIVGTYPNVGQKIRAVDFKLIQKPNAVYQYGTTAVNRYNNQPMLYLFKYIIQDYNTTETPKQVIYNNYTTTETSLALSSGIFNNRFYLFNLQLDLPNNIINYYLDGTYYNFSARTVNKIYSTDVVFPDPTIPFFNANFVSWAKLTQDNSVLVVGNIPSTGSIQFSHFNWRFFQNTEQFFTIAEMNKLKELIAFNYYYDYVSVDKLLDTNEISANNITTRQLVINNNPLVANFTSATRSRDLRSDQTQEAGNVLIEIKNLYVENPSNSGTLNYNLNTKTFTIGSGGSGIGTRSEEDAIILGFIEDSAGTGLQWNATNNTLNVIPESLYQDLTPIYTLISTNDQNVSNYVWETSNYLKGVIDALPTATPYDDTAVYALINTNDQNVSNYVWTTSNYLKGVIDALPPPTAPYDDTAVYTQITTTSNILFSDFVARDTVLTTDYIARDDIIVTDSIERDDNLSASIGANKYTDAKVLTYLQNTATKNFGGFVGIGTTNPLALLEINGTYGTLLVRDNDVNTYNPRIDLIRGSGYFGGDGLTDWRVENLSGVFRISRQNNAFNPTFLECLAIDAVGNVGIGTTSPSTSLQINGVVPTLRIVDTSTSSRNPRIELIAGGTSFSFGGDGTMDWRIENLLGNLQFFTQNTSLNYTPFVISSTGVVRFSVNTWHGDIDGRNRFRFNNLTLGGITYMMGGLSGTANARTFEWIRLYDSATLGYIENTGLLRTWGYSSLSDERIKKDIEDINDDEALIKILALKPKKYNYIEKEKESQNKILGFIAQEVAEIIPEAVSKTVGIIPNIYKFCDVVDNRKVFFNLPPDLAIDTSISITINELGEGKIYKIKEIYNDYFVIDEDIEYSPAFVKGYEVNDLHNVKKDMIFSLNVSATQELHKIIMEQKNEITALKDRLARMEAIVMGMLSGST